MKKITDITPMRGNNRRYRIHFDDGESLTLFDELVVKHSLKAGKEVDSHELKVWIEEDDRRKSFFMATRYLGYRSRSQQEMENYLEGKGFSPDAIAETIGRLKEYGYINDSAFARDWVKNRMVGKPMGKRRISQELIYKGVDEDTIQKALDLITPEEEMDQAKAMAIKYLKGYRDLPAREQLHKVGQALARRGFSWETIRQACRELDIEDPEDY